MKKNDLLSPAPADFKWPRCPEADTCIEETIQAFLAKHSFAAHLALRMKTKTSTRFSDWVDHLLLPAGHSSSSQLEHLGFWEDKKARRPSKVQVFYHPYADLPKIL